MSLDIHGIGERKESSPKFAYSSMHTGCGL